MTSTPGFRAAIVVGSTAVLVGIAILAAKSGPWIGRTTTPETSVPDIDLPTLPTMPPAPPTLTPQTPSAPTDLRPILIGLLIALGVAVLVMIVLWLRQRDRHPKVASEEPELPPEFLEPESTDSSLPFDARIAATDIIASWEQVEKTGEWAGRRRTAQQTPTEFLDRVVAGLEVNTTDRSTLLHLYHQARFDVHALGPESSGAAFAAAQRICGALHSLAQPAPSIPASHR